MADSADTTNPIMRQCSTEGCGKRLYAGGKCNRHYREVLAQTRGRCSIEGCEDYAKARNLCVMHYARLRKTGTPLSRGKTRPGRKEAYLRALLSVDQDECIRWPYPQDRTGYGCMNVGAQKTRAHRFMCVLANGDPPSAEAEAAHNCGNAWCVNPRHLRWATVKENAADRILHGTAKRGHSNWKAKLSNDEALAAYTDPRTCREIAADHGVTPEAIGNLKAGRTWAWLTGHRR